MKKVLTLLLIGIILVGLPIYAWYYLSEGTKMRKQAMTDLEPKAEVGNFQSVTEQDSLFYSESLKGNRWIIAIIGADSLRPGHINIVKNIFKQSKEEFSVHLYSIIGLTQGELIPEMNQKFDLPRDRNWIKTYMAEKHVYVFAADAFSIPEGHKNKNLIIFLDEFGKIRNYYNLGDAAEVKHLSRQVPVFLSLRH